MLSALLVFILILVVIFVYKSIDKKLSIKEAPGQNRTDASSLEGYSSTTELQAHIKE